jgi:hypothetical protein
VDWVHLAQNTDLYLAPVNMVLSFGFHKMHAIPCLPTEILASQGLCYNGSVGRSVGRSVGWLAS